MHTWVKIITDYDENVEVEDIEDEFTFIVDTESSKGNNLLTWHPSDELMVSRLAKLAICVF